MRLPFLEYDSVTRSMPVDRAAPPIGDDPRGEFVEERVDASLVKNDIGTKSVERNRKM